MHLSGDGARIYGEQIAHDLSAALGLLTSPRPCSLMILATGLGELRVALGGGGWCRPLSLAGAGNDVGRGGRRRARAPGERGGQPRRPHLAAREKERRRVPRLSSTQQRRGSQPGSVESSKSPQLCLGPFEQQRFGRVRRDVLLSWHPPDGSGWHETVPLAAAAYGAQGSKGPILEPNSADPYPLLV